MFKFSNYTLNKYTLNTLNTLNKYKITYRYKIT